jgi:hypothetical protein
VSEAKGDVGPFHSIAGGCKGLDDATREGIFPYLARAFGDPEDPASCPVKFIRSGGTLEADGRPMITQAPGYLARLYSVYAFSTSPQTSRMHLNAATNGIGLNKYGTKLDGGQHSVGIVQDVPGRDLGWEGDVEGYLYAFDAAVSRLRVAASLSMFNGGDVTVAECLGALVREIPVIVVAGTLRAADDWAKAIKAGNFVDYARTFIGEGKFFLQPSDVEAIDQLNLEKYIAVANFSNPESFAEALQCFSN